MHINYTAVKTKGKVCRIPARFAKTSNAFVLRWSHFWNLAYWDRTLASVLQLEKRILSASLWKSSMDRAVSSARLLMAAA